MYPEILVVKMKSSDTHFRFLSIVPDTIMIDYMLL